MDNPSHSPGASGIRKAQDFIFDTLPQALAGGLFLIAVTINIVNVVARYVFSSPLFWAEEVLVFIVIWMVFLVMIAITYKGAHLNMDLFYATMRPHIRKIVNVVIALTLLACSAFAATQSYKVVMLYVRNGDVSTAAEVPLFIPHAALLFGFVMIALAVLLRFRAYVTSTFD